MHVEEGRRLIVDIGASCSTSPHFLESCVAQRSWKRIHRRSLRPLGIPPLFTRLLGACAGFFLSAKRLCESVDTPRETRMLCTHVYSAWGFGNLPMPTGCLQIRVPQMGLCCLVSNSST